MHIHHTPRSQYRFLVGIAEGGEYVGDAFDAFFYGQAVGSTSHGADALACGSKDVGVVVTLEFVERGFGHATWHELLP